MHRTRRPASARPRGAAAVAVVLLAALTGCASVTAVPSAGGYAPYAPPVEASDVSLRASFDATAEETHDYWSNPDLFADAGGIEYTNPDNGMTVGASDPATGAYVPPTQPSPAAESANGYGDVPNAVPYDRQGLGASTFGRLYMAFASGNSVCSATVVNSANRDIVVTAAHCLMDLEDRSMAQNVIFVPGDSDNGKNQPYGQWAATEFLMPQNFIDNATLNADGTVAGGGWTTDFAFLVMEEQDGKSIQDVTGGQGIAFGVPVQNLVQIGYPTMEPFDGTDEFMCASTQWSQGWAGGYDHRCDMSPGSSGGGWVAYYDKTLGAGYVVAVNSTGDDTNAEGSILGQQALQLYQQLGG